MNVGTGTAFFDTDTAGIGRAVLLGAAIASVIVAAFVGAVGLWVGAGVGGSLGMGAFAAVWGGPGFGGMLGAVIHVSRKPRVASSTPAVVADLQPVAATDKRVRLGLVRFRSVTTEYAPSPPRVLWVQLVDHEPAEGVRESVRDAEMQPAHRVGIGESCGRERAVLENNVVPRAARSDDRVEAVLRHLGGKTVDRVTHVRHAEASSLSRSSTDLDR
jgi:hypothetical protein